MIAFPGTILGGLKEYRVSQFLAKTLFHPKVGKKCEYSGVSYLQKIDIHH